VAFANACIYGNEEAIKYLNNKKKYESQLMSTIFDIMIRKDNINILKYIWSLHQDNIFLEVSTLGGIFWYLSTNGKLDNLKFLMDCNFIDISIMPNMLQLGFDGACNTNNLNTATLIWEMAIDRNISVDIHYYDNFTFKYCAIRKYTNITNFLIMLSKKINSEYDEEQLKLLNDEIIIY
jgi:hypothetical protein